MDLIQRGNSNLEGKISIICEIIMKISANFEILNIKNFFKKSKIFCLNLKITFFMKSIKVIELKIIRKKFP